MSQFDPEAFLNTNTDALPDTKYTPIPENEYTAIVKDVKFRSFQNKTGDTSNVLEVTWQIDDNELATKLNRQPENLTVRQSVFLDLTDDGTIKTGTNTNIGLGRLREAVGQLKPGKPWAPRHLIGAGPARIIVKHRQGEGDVIYDGVDRVGPMNPGSAGSKSTKAA